MGTLPVADINAMQRQPESLRSALNGFGSLVLVAIVTWVLGSPMLAVVFGLGGIAALAVTYANIARATPPNVLTSPRR